MEDTASQQNMEQKVEEEKIADPNAVQLPEEVVSEEDPVKLTPRQELFCELYATSKEFFGNGVQSYIEAYDPDTVGNWYNSACASASRLLSNVKIINRINSILEETGFNDAFIDKQLSFLVTQHADFGAKIAAIKEYNKLKQRITDKIDHTSGGKPIPILGNTINVQANDSDKENSEAEKANPSDTGGDISQQNNISTTVIDQQSATTEPTSSSDLNSIGELPPSEEGRNEGLPVDNGNPSILQGQALE